MITSKILDIINVNKITYLKFANIKNLIEILKKQGNPIIYFFDIFKEGEKFFDIKFFNKYSYEIFNSDIIIINNASVSNNIYPKLLDEYKNLKKYRKPRIILLEENSHLCNLPEGPTFNFFKKEPNFIEYDSNLNDSLIEYPPLKNKFNILIIPKILINTECIEKIRKKFKGTIYDEFSKDYNFSKLFIIDAISFSYINIDKDKIGRIYDLCKFSLKWYGNYETYTSSKNLIYKNSIKTDKEVIIFKKIKDLEIIQNFEEEKQDISDSSQKLLKSCKYKYPYFVLITIIEWCKNSLLYIPNDVDENNFIKKNYSEIKDQNIIIFYLNIFLKFNKEFKNLDLSKDKIEDWCNKNYINSQTFYYLLNKLKEILLKFKEVKLTLFDSKKIWDNVFPMILKYYHKNIYTPYNKVEHIYNNNNGKMVVLDMKRFNIGEQFYPHKFLELYTINNTNGYNITLFFIPLEY